MYLRTTQRKNRDGSVIRYVQLAHNRRVDGVTQAQVLLNLGREDQLDRDGLRRLVASINHYLGEPDGGLPPADAAQLAGDGLTVVASRPVGTVHLLDGLWQALGVDAALRKVLDPRRFTTNVERVLFALAANRAVDPMSKLSAAEWASNDVAIDGLEAMDEDQAYRAMDLLVEADAQAGVQEAVFFAVAGLLNLEVDLLFFDTTSTYFERGTEEAGDDAFRLYGHSKDHRPDLPQIIICHNPGQAERDRTARQDAVTRLETELARIKQARERARADKKTSTNTKRKAEAAHTRAECALRDHPSLGRWLRQQANGRLVID